MKFHGFFQDFSGFFQDFQIFSLFFFLPKIFFFFFFFGRRGFFFSKKKKKKKDLSRPVKKKKSCGRLRRVCAWTGLNMGSSVLFTELDRRLSLSNNNQNKRKYKEENKKCRKNRQREKQRDFDKVNNKILWSKIALSNHYFWCWLVQRRVFGETPNGQNTRFLGVFFFAF